MAVMPTGAIYKTLTFDGQSSADYHVYITGEAVFNAPERNVEMISIPGRNGAFALDHGRFENIEVTYPAGIVADNETDFAQAVSDFRNFLCSRTGYCRLTDDYNSNEYRMAVYKSGLEVTNAQLLAGEFSITFECKPQRFLTSGESAISVTSGDTITNPTLFDARPLLEVYGEGDIDINGETINVANEPIGTVTLATPKKKSGQSSFSNNYTGGLILSNATNLNNGDAIYSSPIAGTINDMRIGLYFELTPTSGFTPDGTPWDITAGSGTVYEATTSSIGIYIEKSTLYGTSWSESSLSTTIGLSGTYNGASTTANIVVTWNVSYDGTDDIDITLTLVSYLLVSSRKVYTYIPEYIYGDSTKYTTGNPMYIDLDIGEAWNEDSGTPVSVNSAVSMPAELPAFVSGSNTITYDNTVTQLKIAPRWWKV